jgi:hypothetical protein
MPPLATATESCHADSSGGTGTKSGTPKPLIVPTLGRWAIMGTMGMAAVSNLADDMMPEGGGAADTDKCRCCSRVEIDTGGDGDRALAGELTVVLDTEVDRELVRELGLVRLFPLLLPTTLALPLPMLLGVLAVAVTGFLDLITRGGWDEHRPPSWGVPMMKTVSRS